MAPEVFCTSYGIKQRWVPWCRWVDVWQRWMIVIEIRRWVRSKAFWEAAALIVCRGAVSGRLKPADKLLEGKGRDPIRPEETRANPCNTAVWIISKGVIVGTAITSSVHDSRTGTVSD